MIGFIRSVFLGRPIHWLLITPVVIGGYLLGEMRLHVKEFNLFVALLLLTVVVLLVLVLKTSKGDAPVTRDPIPTVGDDEDEDELAQVD